MTDDPLRDLTQNGLLRRLGVPRIPILRRHTPGDPLLPGPALVIGDGRFAVPVRALLTRARIALATGDEPAAAVVLDATQTRTLDDLGALQQILTPAVRRLAPSARLVVLGPEPETDPEQAATAVALEGLVRSAAKEIRAGATANLLVVAADTPPSAVDSSVRFLLSGRSAYVCGQAVRIGVPVRDRRGAAVGSGADPGTDVPDVAARPLAGRVAVVTGAARGIGAAIAETFARDGARVVALDVPAAGQALARVAGRCGGTALQLDITRADAAQRLLAHLRERHGRVDAVVHNAGITRDRLLANMDAERWDAVLAVNLRAQLALNAALLEDDLLSATGRIVCVSSTSGIAGNRGQTNYAASKAGVIGMVRALAPRAADRGVTVNAIAPGFIETEMTARMPLGTREAGRRVNTLRQGGLPVDVAETACWLALAESGAVTGQVVRVCGQSLLGA